MIRWLVGLTRAPALDESRARALVFLLTFLVGQHVDCTPSDTPMKKSNAVPELIVIEERSKRQTVELCGDSSQGLRCALMKGHAGFHECLTLEGPARWQSSKAS